MATEITCGEFEYSDDAATLGERWQTWLERFELFVTGKNLTDDARIKALFLLLMGKEAYDINRICHRWHIQSAITWS